MSDLKKPLGISVLEAARNRINHAFDHFESVYVAYSGGKDSTVMLYLTEEIARQRDRRFGVMVVDLEGQYQLTIDHISAQLDRVSDIADVFWICLPISLRNAVSVYEPKWQCWDPDARDAWIRPLPKHPGLVADPEFFPFFRRGMEFEEFVPLFGEWYAHRDDAHPLRAACLVGIRTDESLNRFRTITSKTKEKYQNQHFTTRVSAHTYNYYPIYDWRTEDIWTYQSVTDLPYNHLYDIMAQAGLSIHQARICQPYGDDQRRGLWLFHLIEPETWSRVVARVNGANSGAMYAHMSGNMTGYKRVSCPEGHTWQSFATLLLGSLPPAMREHYQNKIVLFQRWWVERGYPDGIPDEAPYEQEADHSAPSWRRICKALLRNDYWCKGLGFSQTKSDAYAKYQDLMRRRRQDWGVTDEQIKITSALFDDSHTVDAQ